MTAVPPVHREVMVDADPATAFRVFTAGIGRWWPLATHSVGGGTSTVSFEGDRLVERMSGGATAVWGTVTHWDPGASVAFIWHPGGKEAQATHVSVTFTAEGERTSVVLEHTGWEVLAAPAQARDEYDEGWPLVLGCYQAVAEAGETPIS